MESSVEMKGLRVMKIGGADVQWAVAGIGWQERPTMEGEHSCKRDAWLEHLSDNWENWKWFDANLCNSDTFVETGWRRAVCVCVLSPGAIVEGRH